MAFLQTHRKTKIFLLSAAVSAALATWWLVAEPYQYEPPDEPIAREVRDRVVEEERLDITTLRADRATADDTDGAGESETNLVDAQEGAGSTVAENLEETNIDVTAEEISATDPPVRVPSTPARVVPSLRRTTNYLLVGVDRTWGRAWGRADSLVVAAFDDESGHVGVVSIPRDLYVDVPEHGPARINAVLRVATVTHQDPLSTLQGVVQRTLGLPVHHVVVANLEAVERTIDELGGIEVNVQCPIVDNFIDDRTESGRRILDLSVGRQRLDGATAAMYIRSRHGRSDWSRARRQQAVLLGLKNRVRAAPVTTWVPALENALSSGVTSTMSRLEMIGLVRRLAAVEMSNLHGVVLGFRTVERFRTPEGRAVLVPKPDEIERALRGLFAAPVPGLRPERSRPCPDARVAVE